MSLRKLLITFGLATVLAVAAAGGVIWYLERPDGAQAGSGTALVGGPFTLTDQQGQRVTEQDFAGRFMVVYFGYTYCPDICPLGLLHISEALERLPAAQAEQVAPVFITLDPERDTVEQMAAYAAAFHPRLAALTGSPEEIKQVARAYRVYFAKAKDAGAGDDYLVDHSTFIYLMGPDGQYRTHFSHNVAPEELAERLAAEVGSS